jgi:hypothetical protein
MNNAEVVTVRSVKFSPPFKDLLVVAGCAGQWLLALNHHTPEFARCRYESIQCRRSTAIGRASQIVS